MQTLVDKLLRLSKQLPTEHGYACRPVPNLVILPSQIRRMESDACDVQSGIADLDNRRETAAPKNMALVDTPRKRAIIINAMIERLVNNTGSSTREWQTG